MAENLTPNAPARPVPQPTPQPAEELHGDQLVKLSFWQQPWVRTFLPFGTSLVLHLSILIVGLIAFKTYEVITEQIQQSQEIIPIAELATDGNPGGTPNPGSGGDPSMAAMQNLDRDRATDDGTAQRETNMNSTGLADAGGAGELDTGLIARGPNTALGRGRGVGIGTGDGSGAGGGGGRMAPFGRPGGGAGSGPPGLFQPGTGGNARQIVFVADASGSMVGPRFELLKIELRKTVGVLRANQFFNVIFFRDDLGEHFNPQGLIPANDLNRARLNEFLDTVRPRNFHLPDTDPIGALETAYRQGAELIYFLADGGDFRDYNALIRKIEQLHKENPRTKINAILFNDGEHDQVAIDIMTRLSNMTGGTFRHVTTRELTGG